jgi:hypothetical protein
MLDRLRPRITYANVVATLALFIAVGGGTAFAVVAANQVNSRSIIDGQVKKADIASNAVGSGKVINNSLRAADIAPNSIGGGRIDESKLAGLGAGAVFGAYTGGSTIVGGSPRFASATDAGDSIVDETDAPAGISPPRAMVARDLTAGSVEGSLASGASVKFSLVVGGTTTQLSCTIPEGGTTCDPADTSHAVAVPAGRTLRMKLESVGTTANVNPPADLAWSWRLVTP